MPAACMSVAFFCIFLYCSWSAQRNSNALLNTYNPSRFQVLCASSSVQCLQWSRKVVEMNPCTRFSGRLRDGARK